MIISSLVVEVMPDKIEKAIVGLGKIEGVEVHDTHDNQIVVTIEAETVDKSHETASSFIAVEGVVNINLIYVNFEDDPYIVEAAAKQAASR